MQELEALQSAVSQIEKNNSKENIWNLFEALQNFKKRVDIITTQDKDGFEEILSQVEEQIFSIFQNYISWVVEELSPDFEKLKKIIQDWWQTDSYIKKLLKKIEKTWNDSFDKFVVAQVLEKINDFIQDIKKALIDKYLRENFASLKAKMDELFKELEQKIKNLDILWIDEGKIMETIIIEIEQIQNNIEAGSEIESHLKEISKNFEQRLKEEIAVFLYDYFEQKIKEDIKDFISKTDFEKYENRKEFKKWQKMYQHYINDWIKEMLIDYENIKSKTILNNLWKSEFIRKKWNLVYFWEKPFPIYNRKTTISQSWKINPKIQWNNVIVGFSETKNKSQIKPSDEKKLRWDDRKYEYSRDEYKKLMQDYEKAKKSWDIEKLMQDKSSLLQELSIARKNHKTTLETEDITPEILEIKQKLQLVKEQINVIIPHFLKVLERLNKMKIKSYWDVPELWNHIKITPYILENLKKLISLAGNQIVRQDWIWILEWEAWVGKNVLIDIFAHHTNRPVFTFACNKRASKEDLTYQWLINENGTYKLHSKVYEAIKTPWAILVFDEINTLPPEVIKLLNGLFDYRRTLTMSYDNEHQKSLDDVLIFGTQNSEHYDWTQKLPQDVSSRANKLYIDYPWLQTQKEWVDYTNYDEALISYANMPYFYKLLDVKWYSKEDIQEINLLKLRKNSKQELTQEEQKQINDLELSLITETEFIETWNDIFNLWKEIEIKESFWVSFVEWLKDIYILLQYTYYIRDRYKAKKEWKNKLDSIDISVSQRDLNNMMSLLCEWYNPRDAFIQIYVPSISNMEQRDKLKTDLENLVF